MEPSTFLPHQGDIVTVRLRVGQDLIGDPLPRDPSHIRQFIVADNTGRNPIPGRTGMNPAGILRASTPGMLVLGYYSNPSILEQTSEKFEQYLKEEGLDAIAAQRKKAKASGPVRELFTRCAKSLVLSGPARADQQDKSLGFPLELTALRNPYLNATEELPLRLTYENRPLAGQLVVAMNRSNPMEKVTARTGADGKVTLRLRHGGMWMIKSVHLVPAPKDANAEWISYWASLTFEMPVRRAGR
ncbi:MAG: DUF4198 domain-containing protein [Acidobacteria bacterium]|nr:DUF4198 domain-containing protein [Acidobacteriota bacterium]